MTGTFTDLAYNREGGDVMGTEIRIVAGRHGLQATVQVAEGSPSDLVLIPTVRVGQGEKLRFDLPPNDLDLRSFDGVVTITSCTRETDPASKADFIGPFIRKAIGTGCSDTLTAPLTARASPTLSRSPGIRRGAANDKPD